VLRSSLPGCSTSMRVRSSCAAGSGRVLQLCGGAAHRGGGDIGAQVAEGQRLEAPLREQRARKLLHLRQRHLRASGSMLAGVA
jgi:hypothetical protein